MTMRLGCPGTYTIVDTDKVLGDNDGVVPIVQATD
jgi:regulator of RNase E activity RraA